jgi:hypothetical protein
MVSAIIFWFVAVASCFIASVVFTTYGIRKRKKLLRRASTVATVSSTHKFRATITWQMQGGTYATSPFNFYAIRKGEKIRIFFDPFHLGDIRLDTWTSNYRWAYIVALATGVVGLGLLGLLYYQSM